MKRPNTTTTSNSNTARPVTFEDVYANKEVIVAVGRRLKWDSHSCEDLVQEVALKCLWGRQIIFDPAQGRLKNLLARIARNTAVDIWRKNRHTPVPTEDIELAMMLEGQVDYSDEVLEQELWEERRKLLEQGIREMYRRFPSKEGNEAFLMFSRDGMHAKAVAEKLGVSERFVNVSVHRGLKRLKAIVHCLSGEDCMGRKVS